MWFFAANTYFRHLRQNFRCEENEAEAKRESVVVSQKTLLEKEAHEKGLTLTASYLWEMSRPQSRKIAESR